MAFSCSTEMDNGIAKVTLSGELDAASAPKLRDEVDRAASEHARRLVLLMEDLDYMSSAGLRTLIFAKQKMGPSVDIYVVGANEGILETLQLTGFQYSVHILPTYDAAEIESV